MRIKTEKAICAMNLMHSAQLKANHITPWREGGETVPENSQTLRKSHNRRKGDM